MIEKTLRYPGHVEHIRALRDSGFFDTEEIEVRGRKVRPLDVTSAVLFKHWRLHEDDDEFTIMRIIVEGEENGRPKRIEYDLFDRRDRATGFSSMARTTGFPGDGRGPPRPDGPVRPQGRLPARIRRGRRSGVPGRHGRTRRQERRLIIRKER